MASREQLVEMLGGKCDEEGCATSDMEVLHLHHKNGDGNADLSGFYQLNERLYVYYLRHPEEANERLQVLCANHHWKKRYSAFGQAEPKVVEAPIEKKPKNGFFSEWTSPDGKHFVIWKDDPGRLPPERVSCSCGESVWQIFRDQSTEQLYLRCLDCEADYKMRLTR